MINSPQKLWQALYTNDKLRVRIKHYIALTGVLLLFLNGLLFIRGLQSLEAMDAAETRRLAEIARDTLLTDLASATLMKMPLATGMDTPTALIAMSAYAKHRKFLLRVDAKNLAKTRSSSPYLAHAQACDDATLQALGEAHPLFLAHLPCQIVVLEIPGQGLWLATLDPERLLSGGHSLNPRHQALVRSIKARLLGLMAAGSGQPPPPDPMP